jgi:hypothetical protein
LLSGSHGWESDQGDGKANYREFHGFVPLVFEFSMGSSSIPFPGSIDPHEFFKTLLEFVLRAKF